MNKGPQHLSLWPREHVSDSRLVSEQFSQTPQKLSFYSWYGSSRLFRFLVPSDTVLLRWLLQVTWNGGHACARADVTVYIRYGAPPVINPLGANFSANTSAQPPFQLKMDQNLTTVNISHPAPGDWFLAAHLPPSAQKLEMQGTFPSCSCVFHPEMLVVRVLEASILEPDMPLPQVLLSRPSYLKVFVPEFTQALRLELQGCATNASLGCPVHLTVGSATLPSNFQKVLTCSSPAQNCRLLLPSPPWNRWLQVTAQSTAGPHVVVAFSIVAALRACKPWNLNIQHLVPRCNMSQSCNTSSHLLPPVPSSPNLSRSIRAAGGLFCFVNIPIVREDVDVVSVRFQPLDRLPVLVRLDMPSVLRLPLSTGMDSGGSLTISLRTNKSIIAGNSSVAVCVNPASPFLSFRTSLNCTTAFFQGSLLTLSASAPEASLVIPYPETDNWYLSLQLVCPQAAKECEQAVLVDTTLHLVPCLNDCGPYGHCLLLRRHGYLYASCSCKAGWRGWSCTDNSTAQTLGQQTAATLLLTLSNLLFLAPIVVSLRRSLLVEASVYTYTMFFSTFYHACDQPGEAVLCILSYDTLQFCDFLGSSVAIWVTILCMARLRASLKYVLYLLGSLTIAMSLQMSRQGLWNTLGPSLFAMVIMVTMWVYRCGRRRHCYPPSWQRWAFCLLPGISMATVAMAIFIFMTTSDNYYYMHSLWHMLLAGSAAVLLPPSDEPLGPWACSRKLTCTHEPCSSRREELYAVT